VVHDGHSLILRRQLGQNFPCVVGAAIVHEDRFCSPPASSSKTAGGEGVWSVPRGVAAAGDDQLHVKVPPSSFASSFTATPAGTRIGKASAFAAATSKVSATGPVT